MLQESGRRTVGRPPLTDRSALLAAAREIGFARLTVGAVTAQVGVKYSTFYRHFPSLDALLTALVDEVCAEVELPPPDRPWRAVIAETCSALFDLHQRNPGLAETVLRLPTLPSGALSFYRSLTDALVAAGLPAAEAALGAVYAIETVSTSGLTTPGAGHTLAARQQEIESADALAVDVRAATAGIAEDAAREWTMRKIDLLIRGLASVVEVVPTQRAPQD